jgi:hypothetical protein
MTWPGLALFLAAHANSYIAKPIDLHEFIDVVRSIEGYWLSIVRLPVRDGGAAVRG